MRVLILPLVIVLLCCSLPGFSQGTNCSTAYDVATSCTAPSAISATTGGPVGTCTGTTGRVTWFRFVAGSTCPAISFYISGGGAFQVVAYTTCVGTTESGLVAGTTACFASSSNGSGVWSPSAALTNGTTYYLRVATGATSGTITACNLTTSANSLDVTGGCSSFSTSASIGLRNNTCGTSTTGYVTWFKFTADASCPNLSIDNSFSTATTPIANEASLYSACGNASATLTASSTTCSANGSMLWPPTGLTVGQTY